MPIIRPATQEEADNRLKNAFINQDFGSLGGEVELYPLPDRKALLYSSATSAWAERILGAPVNPYNPGWQGTKDGIVRNYFGEREAKDVSDEDLFGKIAADYQTLDSLKDAAKIAAYRGETSVPWARRFQEVKEQGKMPLGRARDYLQITKQVHDEYRAKIEPYRQTINTVTALATDGEDAANFDAMARELLKVPKDDRPFVIEALASQAPDVIDQGGISNIALIWGRSIERFLSKSGTGLQEMLTPAGNVSEIPLEPETPEETANREARQRDVEDFRELRDQIRDVANGKLAPVESVRFLGMNISGAVESVPMTMAAFIPYAGPAALIGNFQRETFNELRSTNPTMTREAAQSIATISAPFQALTEVVSDRLLFGKLPSLKRAFTAPAFTAGGVAKQVAQRVAVGTAVETGEEFVQGVTPLLVQSLSADVPGVDWQGYFDRFGENLPEMILTILPLAIVGAGTGQLSDFATGRMLATSPQHLTASGYSPEASAEIANAATSGDWAKAENLMRADWAKVNAKGKAVSEVAGQAAVRVEEARAAQVAAVQEVVAQNKEEETRALAIEEELARRGELPDVMINPQTGKYRVIDREGNVLVETDKRADALNVAYSTLEENQRIAAEATVQIFDELMATRGTQAEGAVVSQRRQTAQTLVDEGIVSYDQMMQGAMTAAKADGVSEQQAQIDSSTINGFSRAEYWDQVRTMVSRTFATGGVETAIHETVHNRVRRGMANGTYTREMALEWVRAAERALEGKTDKAGKPIKFLPSENDAEIDDRVLEEAVAELAVADTIGRRKSGTRFTPGLIAQGISARLRAEKNAFLGKTKEERAEARKGGNLARFKLFLQGWKETLGNMLRIARQVQTARQEGKLGEDFDAFLDNLLGTDAQSRYDLQTQQEAKEILEEGNMPFSMNRKGGDLREYSVEAFHGTNSRKFNQFDILNLGKGSGNEGLFSAGFYFSPSSDDAKGYGKNLVAVGLKVKNPLIVPDSFPVMMRGDDSAEYWASFDAQMKSALKSVFSANNFNEVDRVDAVQMDESFVGSFSRAYKALSGVSLPPSKAAEVSANLIQRAGFDAVYAKDGDTTTEIVVYDPSNILVKEWNGKTVESPMFSMGKPSVKTAIEVDGKIHTTAVSHYDATLDYIVRQMPAYQREDMEAAREKAGEILTNEWLKDHNVKQGFVVDGEFMTREETLAKVKEMGIPTPLADEENRSWFDSQDIQAMQDIRFSSRSMASVLEAALEAQRRNPEFRERLLRLTVEKTRQIRQDGPMRVNKRGVVSQRKGTDTMAENDRTKANIEAERKFRLRSRQRELIDAGMAQLTPETLAAYDQGLTTLEDNPLINSMLNDHGKLMSKTAAEKAGKLRTDGKGNAGDYDDAPRLPIAWYSKSGGIMPDVMAENLGFDSVPAFWEALRSAIYSTRTANEAFQKARAAVRQVEVDALAQATKEANKWAAETEAKVPTPKEKQLAALRTLDAILSIFPPEIHGKVGGMYQLAKANTDAAREKEILKRVEIIDKVLEKEGVKLYSKKLIKLLDSAAPVGKPGEVKKSKFIVTVQDELDAISEMVGMDSDEVADLISKNEAAIISAQTPEAADAALTELNLLEIFGGVLDLKRTSSQELAVASEYLENLLKQGREARKIIDEARRDRVKDMVNTAKSEAFKGDAGPETTQAAKAAAAKSGKTILKKFFNELSGFDGVLRDVFGAGSKTAREFSERFTLNSNNYEDVQNERRKRFRDFARELYGTKLGAKINQKLIALERIENNSGVTYLKGREVKSHKFTEADAAKIVADPKAFGFTAKDAAAISEEIQAIKDAGGRRKAFTYEQVTNDGDRVELPLSQMDALYISMALRQPGILEQQQRYGYDQETVDQLEKFLTDDSKAWREWMQGEYDAEYQRANEVYMRMFNARMPKLMFYAPLLKNHQGQQAILDPLNTGISSNSANPGSIKSRKARTSSLRIDSALSVFWSHFNQMEYWIANAEYLRDVQSVMLNPEVRQSVVSAHGEDGMATVSAWVQLQMSRGVGKAALATAGSKMFRNVKSAISMKALALSLGTTLKTLPSLFYSLGEIHMSKWPAALASGMKHWSRLWNTNIIQRRLDIGGMPELRDLGSSALPMSWVNQGIRYGSYPTMYADGVFTTYSAAMAYGTSFDDAKMQGASDEVAHKYAEERTALIVSKTAQPENWTQKSLFENDLSGAGSLFFMFTSDPRQKLALTGEALNRWRKGGATTEEAMRKLLAYWIIPGIMFQLANAIGRSLFKGDDDEWEVVDFATAALAGQLQGLALIGSAAEMIFSAAIAAAAEKITGEEVKRKPFWNSPKNPLDGAANDLIKSVEKITEDDTKDGLGKAWEIMKSAGMLLAPMTPAGAIPSTTERVMKDTTNLFYREE